MEPSQERRLDQWGDNPSPSLKPFDSGWGGGFSLSWQCIPKNHRIKQNLNCEGLNSFTSLGSHQREKSGLLQKPELWMGPS